MKRSFFKIATLVVFVVLHLTDAKETQTRFITESSAGPESDAAIMARLVINNVNWAAFGTISTNVNVEGFPMANILGISDGPLDNGKGIPYILMSHDISGKDILKDSNISISVSLAQTGYCKYHNYDQQDPRCARVTFIGTYKNLSSDDPNYAYAKSSLKERHPHLENWNTFYLGKLDIHFIALLDWFGGPKIIPLDEYFNVKPHEYSRRLNTRHLNNRQKIKQSKNKSENCAEDFIDDISEVISTFVIHNADWGSVTTLAYSDDNPNVIDGTPFNSVVSVADGFVDSGSGIPYLYVTPLDFVVKHTMHDKRISMILTLAGTRFCKNLDPISDFCPAVILTGTLVQFDPESIEYNYAQMALFSRHASMARLPTNHDFRVNKLSIDYVQLRYKVCNEMGRVSTTAWRSVDSNNLF